MFARMVYKFLIAGVLFLSFTGAALAETKDTVRNYGASVLIPAKCLGAQVNNDCQLSEVEELLANIGKLILGISGSLSLLVFVYGGLLYVTSAGEPAKVSKAHEVLKNGVIGMAMVLSAGALVKIFLEFFG